jgi:hypothetical protein
MTLKGQYINKPNGGLFTGLGRTNLEKFKFSVIFKKMSFLSIWRTGKTAKKIEIKISRLIIEQHVENIRSSLFLP